MSARGHFDLGQKVVLVTVAHCVLSCLAVMDRFVMRSIRDPHPGPNPASSEATDTPFT